jgi:hypothetical protein
MDMSKGRISSAFLPKKEWIFYLENREDRRSENLRRDFGSKK